MAMTKDQVRAWLLEYAWMDDADDQAREVDCIMSQDGWEFVNARADMFAGTQFEPGPKAFDEGMGWALSSLYECHDGPHTDDCPRNHD